MTASLLILLSIIRPFTSGIFNRRYLYKKKKKELKKKLSENNPKMMIKKDIERKIKLLVTVKCILSRTNS